MSAHSVLMLIGVVLVLMTSQGNTCDSCELIPYLSNAADVDLFKVDIPIDCTEGSISWDYTVDSFQVSLLRSDEPFFLCLEVTSTSFLEELKDMTNETAVVLRNSTEGSSACASSLDGRAVFLVKSSTPHSYSSDINYRVVLAA